MSEATVTKTLPFGPPATDGNEPQRRVTFGRRLTAGDQIAIEDDALATTDVQRTLLYARASIVEFGGKEERPRFRELLGLARVDRETLEEGYIEFLAVSLGDRAQEKVGDAYKLAFGLVVDGETYDLVSLCDAYSKMTGFEEVQIERNFPGNLQRDCVLLGRDVALLSQSEGSRTVEGPLTIEQVEQLDFFDLNFLRVAAAERRQLFRRSLEGEQQPDAAATADVNDSTAQAGE